MELLNIIENILLLFQKTEFYSYLLTRPTLNNPDRLRTLINSLANDLAMSVPQSGHMYAMSAAAKSLSPAAQQAELFSQVILSS